MSQKQADCKKSVEFSIMAKCFATIVTTKLRNEVREKRSGVYNIFMDVDYTTLAKNALFIVQFSCDPCNCDDLIAIVHSVLESFHGSETILDKDIDIMKKILKKQHELRLRNDSNWLFWMLDSKKVQHYVNVLDSDMASPNTIPEVTSNKWFDDHLYKRHQGYTDFVDKLEKRELQCFGESVLNMQQYRIFVLSPVEKALRTQDRENVDAKCKSSEGVIGNLGKQTDKDVDNIMHLSSLAIKEGNGVDMKLE